MTKSKPRSIIVRNMILHTKGGSMKHRLDRRSKERKDIRHYTQDDDGEENDDQPLDDNTDDAYALGVDETNDKQKE